jgi:L-Ala-D/L-Glu epimerase
MIGWLREQGVEYVEQPLAEGQEALMGELKARATLPIFADESCWSVADIPQLADQVDGINIKLMKCGGLAEARRMVETAKACGLQVMLGCYSDSALLNSAAAQLAPLVDYLDLDSHLNLTDDPFVGAQLEEGRLVPRDAPGLGVVRCSPSPDTLSPAP